jgi:hypothetical protein
MALKKIKIIAVILLVLWLISLGLHLAIIIEIYLSPEAPRYQYDDFVNGEVSYYTSVSIHPNFISGGIPYLLSYEANVLPYAISFVIYIDDNYETDSFVLQKLTCMFDDGDEEVVVKTSQSSLFTKDSNKDRESKVAFFIFPDAIKRKGSFNIKYKGYLTGDEKSIEGIIRAEFSKSTKFAPGWFMFLLRRSGV